VGCKTHGRKCDAYGQEILIKPNEVVALSNVTFILSHALESESGAVMNSDDQVEDIFSFDPDRVQRYKVILRRNRLFGFWAGEQLGKLDCEMLDYIATAVHSDLEEPGDLDILRKVHGDLLAFGKMDNEADLCAKLAELQEQARHEMGALSRGQDVKFKA
jgi:hypothetical protein